MKKNILRLLYLIAILLVVACEKENNPSVCGIEDPLLKIEWLRELKVSLEEDVNVKSAEIILYQLESKDYIYIQKKLRDAQDFPNSIYDCEGNVKYMCGGNKATDNCTTFFQNAQMVQLLWHN